MINPRFPPSASLKGDPHQEVALIMKATLFMPQADPECSDLSWYIKEKPKITSNFTGGLRKNNCEKYLRQPSE